MRAHLPDPDAWAWFDGLLATGLGDITDDATALDGPGFWAVVVSFEGEATFARFSDVRRAPVPRTHPWQGPRWDAWHSSLTREQYLARVASVRELIASGEVYQVNLCRVLTALLPSNTPDLGALHARLHAGNPAPYAGVVDLPRQGVRVVSASPELLLGRRGHTLTSGPIKGTGRISTDLRTKDVAENVMITDLVRNDLGRVARTGSVTVPDLCVVENHPGLVHLVSRVRCVLPPEAGWAELLAATLPPGSVSGAPKSSALRAIAQLETVPRGPYCGAIGWVHDRERAALGVGIRTFWVTDESTGRSGGAMLHFGTGAGVVWDSDPLGEWEETALKARRLVALASESAAGPATRPRGAA